MGSTTAVTDASGNVKYSYAYSPYGELLSGTYGQVLFLYNGQYGVTSDNNGLYYMRARYYNIAIKRFCNQDILTGEIGESKSLNRYAYVEGNPVSYIDPFGLDKNSTSNIFKRKIIDLLAPEVKSGKTVSYGITATASAGLSIGISVQLVMIILVSVCFCIFHVWEQIKENVSFFVAVFAMMSLFVFFFFVLIYLFVRLLKENRCLNSVIKKGNECDAFYAECIECKSINSLVFWRVFKVLDGSNKVFAVNSFQNNVAVLRVKEGDTVTVVLFNGEYVAIY